MLLYIQLQQPHSSCPQSAVPFPCMPITGLLTKAGTCPKTALGICTGSLQLGSRTTALHDPLMLGNVLDGAGISSCSLLCRDVKISLEHWIGGCCIVSAPSSSVNLLGIFAFKGELCCSLAGFVPWEGTGTRVFSTCAPQRRSPFPV